ncbi:predicted protein [Histoplasma capsulatum H143]|uniref:Uncharacterized protein n=1 Tax=Ajellomyces capsulatus (strain H143) TaxID=544712 RepID=C6H8I6_AJECH|nr:predicted protein [Histoplasma capsulatum H143]
MATYWLDNSKFKALVVHRREKLISTSTNLRHRLPQIAANCREPPRGPDEQRDPFPHKRLQMGVVGDRIARGVNPAKRLPDEVTHRRISENGRWSHRKKDDNNNNNKFKKLPAREGNVENNGLRLAW